MGINDGSQLASAPDYLMPAVGRDGVWGSVGGIALRSSLERRSAGGVMDLIKSMDVRGLAAALRESGFDVDQAVVERGRSAVFAGVKADLNEALALGVDGFGLAQARSAALAVAVEPVVGSFAAKDYVAEVPLEFDVREFAGDVAAARMIQGVMRADCVSVDLLGDAEPGKRGALLMVAGQALKKGVQGFSFDGLPGKFEVPLSMAELVDLHRDAAQAVAVESASAGLGVWAAGGKVSGLDEWVPDSVQRLLYGSVSLSSSQALVQAIEGGGIVDHAGQIGSHAFTALLSAQGLDVNAKTVIEQALESGWLVQEPDRFRGQYFGSVVAVDHRASLVKFSRADVIELPFADLAAGQARPKMGDQVRMDFKAGALTVNVAARLGREGAGR